MMNILSLTMDMHIETRFGSPNKFTVIEAPIIPNVESAAVNIIYSSSARVS